MSRWGNHNKYSKMAIKNNFVARQHGHIVATELSQAQLYLFEETFFYSWPNLICVALDAKFVVKGRPAVSVKSANWKGIFFSFKNYFKIRNCPRNLRRDIKARQFYTVKCTGNPVCWRVRLGVGLCWVVSWQCIHKTKIWQRFKTWMLALELQYTTLQGAQDLTPLESSSIKGLTSFQSELGTRNIFRVTASQGTCYQTFWRTVHPVA